MSEKSKYYTPHISEFYVGFEFEFYDEEDRDWNKTTINCQSDLCNWTGFDIEKKVKYLDKEDIESLGFFSDNTDSSFFETKDEKRWINMEYFEKGKGWYLSFDEEENQFAFSGYVKNKSELKRVLKQLEDKLDERR